MKRKDLIKNLRNLRRRQRNKAKTQLNQLCNNKGILQRPVFFVPGWTDESCKNWLESDERGTPSMKEWISKIIATPNFVSFIKFTDAESKRCSSFLDFGNILKAKIWAKIGKKEEFDIVGHSMGGLDIVAAIIHSQSPLQNVNHFVSVATPHQGSDWGELSARFKKFSKLHHKIQCKNLDPDQPPIKVINTLTARKRLLQKINRLYCLIGTRDMAVMGSSKYKRDGLDSQYYNKKVEICVFGGATHSQARGITRDSRTVLAIIQILTGIELEKPKYNYGFIF